MALLLLICFAAALVYTAALVIGQPFSVSIHNAVSEYMLPAVYRAGILLSFDGLINISEASGFSASTFRSVKSKIRTAGSEWIIG